MYADHIRRQEVVGLAEHAGFGFNAAHAPGQNTDAVDHGGVRVGADGGVGIVDPFFFPDAARQVFQIDLVADAVARRYHADAVKGLFGPLEEGVTLAVALEFDFHVLAQRVFGVADVDDDGVIDDEIYRNQRFDPGRFEVLALGFSAHRGEIVQRGETGHVLQHDAGEHEGNFLGAFGVRLPSRQFAHAVFTDTHAIAVAQHRLQHHAQAHRQTGDLAEAGFFQRGQRVVLTGLARIEFEFAK